MKKSFLVLTMTVFLVMGLFAVKSEALTLKYLGTEDPILALNAKNYFAMEETEVFFCLSTLPKFADNQDFPKIASVDPNCDKRFPYNGWKYNLKWINSADKTEWQGGSLIVVGFPQKGKKELKNNYFAYLPEKVELKWGEKPAPAASPAITQPSAPITQSAPEKTAAKIIAISQPTVVQPAPTPAAAPAAANLPPSGSVVAAPPAGSQPISSTSSPQPETKSAAADCNTSLKLDMPCSDVLRSMIETPELGEAIKFAISVKSDTIAIFHSTDVQERIIAVETDKEKRRYQFFGSSVPGETLTQGCVFTLKEIKLALLKLKSEGITVKNGVGIYFSYVVREESSVSSEVKERKESDSGSLTKVSFTDTDGVILDVKSKGNDKPFNVPICNMTDIKAKENSDRNAILALYDIAGCPPMKEAKIKKMKDCDSATDICDN